MQSILEIKSVIYSELTAADQKVTTSFLSKYGTDAKQFAELMAYATIAWHELALKVKEHEKAVFVVNIAYCAIMLHIQSMKLFLSGHIVPAGNLSRQVIEAIAMALLSS